MNRLNARTKKFLWPQKTVSFFPFISNALSDKDKPITFFLQVTFTLRLNLWPNSSISMSAKVRPSIRPCPLDFIFPAHVLNFSNDEHVAL